MRAMVLEEAGLPLVLRNLPAPLPAPHEVLIKVSCCGVCRTDLHIVDGELKAPKLPLIPGHQVVGIVAGLGEKAQKYKIGSHVGAPWLGGTDGTCDYCRAGRENLCDRATFTGYSRNGGYAEYCTVHEEYLIPLPERYDDLQAAPLLCAGLIGYRAFRLANAAKTIGFYGFGSSAHILIQVAARLGKEVYVFTRPQDNRGQNFARSLGAKWAGGSDEMPPERLTGRSSLPLSARSTRKR
jgi:alcohol dehydrogenase, propanol-preferring